MNSRDFRIDGESLIKLLYKEYNILPDEPYSGTTYERFISILRGFYKLEYYKIARIIVRLRKEGIIVDEKIIINGNVHNKRYVNIDMLKALYDIEITNIECEYNPENTLLSQSLIEKLDGAIYDICKENEEYKVYEYLIKKRWRDYKCIKDDRHFTIRKDGVMTYTPKGKMTVISDQKWVASNKYRQETKIGKGLKKIFSNTAIDIPNSIIEKLNNKLKSYYVFGGKFDIVEGEDIRNWYLEDNYSSSNTGSLEQSCMRYEECQDYFDIYVYNPSKVKMLIAINEDNCLIGRALLWNTNEHGQVMDRIYGNDVTIQAFKNYAKENGLLHKVSQSYNDSKMVSSIGEVIDEELTVTLQGNFESYPYMDTFKYTDKIEDEMTLNTSNGNYSLTETDGGPNDMVRVHDGSMYHEDDVAYVERYGEYYHNDDVTYSRYLDDHVITVDSLELYGGQIVWDDSDDIAFAEDTGEYHLDEDLSYSEHNNCYYYSTFNCPIVGIVQFEDTIDFQINDRNITVCSSVTIEDLLEKELITAEEYAKYNEGNN
ncbi:MAG: hypothetical protein ABF265_07805 [Polaribacter sp.]